MKTIFAVLVFAAGCSVGLRARVDLLLVPPEAPVLPRAGLELVLHLNNPTDLGEVVYLPASILADYATGGRHDHVRLRLVDPADARCFVPAMTRRSVKLALEEEIRDPGRFASLRLVEPQTNAIMFEVSRGANDTLAKESMALPATAAPGGSIDLASDVELMRRHISAYDPIYFAIGWRDRFNARFQFSFKYRLFDRGPPDEAWWKQVARDVYVAYTQTSIWDLEAFSRPFYDSSYKPTIFLLHEDKIDADGTWRVAWQAGFQHESNGKGGGAAPVPPQGGLVSTAGAARHPSDSRSFNSLYVAPKVRWTRADGLFTEAGLRASAYFQTDDNDDIARYRGYLEANFRAGFDRGLQVAVQARGHPRGHGSFECNASWPANRTPLLRFVLPETMGGYAQIQYFNGYGESLLDYDVRRKDQLRFGLMLVR